MQCQLIPTLTGFPKKSKVSYRGFNRNYTLPILLEICIVNKINDLRTFQILDDVSIGV